MPDHDAADTPVGRFSIRLLGRPQCRHCQTGQWHDLAPKAAALLALLLLDGPAPRAALGALLWPDKAGDKPRNNLRRLLTDLRVLAGGDICTGLEVLALADGVAHDLDSDPATASLLLALNDYSDLDDFQQWLLSIRQRRLQLALSQLGLQADALQARGRWPEATAIAELMLALAPGDEAAYRRLMRALALAGDPGAALATYARCKAEVWREHGVAPTQPTQALALLIELNEPVPVEPGKTLPAALTPLRLVARSGEQAAITAAWAAGLAILLEGEPGVGKSRLAQELAPGDGAVLLTEARYGDADVPFATLMRLLQSLLKRWRPRFDPAVRQELARLLPQLGPPCQTPAHLPALQSALISAWAAWRAAGLQAVIVDDLQWADEVSIKLLLGLTLAPETTHWLLTCRSGMRPPLLQASLNDTTSRWQALALQPLDTAAVQALLQALPLAVPQAPAWAKTLGPRCLGNPLHVMETVRALLQVSGSGALVGAPPADGVLPVPAGLDKLVRGRLHHLPEAEEYLAQLAALAGSLLTVEMACKVTGLHELAIGKAWAALDLHGVLKAGVLGHDSLRQPLLDSMPAPVARAMHLRIAELAATAGAPPAAVARHWRLAERWQDAGQAYAQAAAEAFALNARADEMQLWDLACDGFERAFSDTAAHAARLRAFEAAMVVQPADKVELRVEALVRTAETDADRIEASTALARLRASQYRWPPALEAATQAVAMAKALATRLPASGLGPMGLRASMVMASALGPNRRALEAIAALQEIEPEVDASDSLQLQMQFAGTCGHVYGMAERFVEAGEWYERGAGLAESLHDGAEAMMLRSNCATVLARRGNLALALESCLCAERWAVKIGESGSISGAAACLALGGVQTRLGHYAEGLARLHAAHADMLRNGSAVLVQFCEIHLAVAYVDLGQPWLARQALATPADAVPTGRRAARAFADGLIRRLEQDSHRAPPMVIEGPDHDRALTASLAALVNEPLANRLTLELSCTPDLPPLTAAARCSAVAERAAASGARATESSAWLCEAEAWHRAGEHTRSADLTTRVLDDLSTCVPSGIYWPSVWWLAWRVFGAVGQHEAARQALASGLGWVQDHALPQVPPEFRGSFLQGNPVNRQLLMAAKAQGLT